jgi:putative endonuclease
MPARWRSPATDATGKTIDPRHVRNPRQKHSQIYGVEAEWLAAVFLRLKGYRILARRFAAAGGEIDLVAERFGTLIFVEVKARNRIETARIAISADKLRRIERAARVFLARRQVAPRTIRLDAIFLSPNALPRHETAIAELRLD